MTSKDSTTKKIAKSTATVGGALAVAFVPQYCSADIVTVGGDGGTGSVTLVDGVRSNLGGVLGGNGLSFYTIGGSYGYLSGAGARLFPAERSSQSVLADVNGGIWTFLVSSDANEGALFNSTDNWVPGTFQVNGVNGGNPIWGWLHVGLGSASAPSPEIISFTYDNEATDTTAFAKPIGGFSVATAVPEPSSLSLLALLAMGAGAMGRYRKESAVAA